MLPLTRTDNNDINRFILTAVPKYNNYIKRPTSWSTSQAEIVTVDDGTVFQYTIYRTNKSAVERQYLLLDRLFYGTEVYFFSDIMSITVGNNDIDTQIPSLMVNSEIVQSEDSKHNYIRNVIFQASHNLSTFYTLCRLALNNYSPVPYRIVQNIFSSDKPSRRRQFVLIN